MVGSRRGAALLLVAACVVTGIVVAVGSALDGRSTPSAGAPPGALALQSAFVNVVRIVSPSVVQIETSQGLGSGVVFDRKGNIVTNAHVVGTARKFTVTTSSGKRLDATLVGKFEANDLAVIRVSAALTPASFADSSKLKVGNVVLAIGNPLGLRSSVT
jgi:putative serine protease PepD